MHLFYWQIISQQTYNAMFNYIFIFSIRQFFTALMIFFAMIYQNPESTTIQGNNRNIKNKKSLFIIENSNSHLMIQLRKYEAEKNNFLFSRFFSRERQYMTSYKPDNRFHTHSILKKCPPLQVNYEISATTVPRIQMNLRSNSCHLTIVLVSISVFFIITTIILFIAFIRKTKNNRLLQNIEEIHTNFFTQIVHEFRTPLTIILGLSKQLKSQGNISPQTYTTYLSAIERQARSLSNLVNQLLDIANLNASPRTVEWKTGNIVAYIEMLYESFRLFASQKGINLIFYSEETTIKTDFVPNYLNKILQNLLSNAIKYSKEGDKITLTLERKKKDGKKLLIKVVDQGKGIDKKAIPYIFNLFYQAPSVEEPIGSGIGLTLSKQLTDILGGNISVESEPGKGSVFIVELPINRNEKELFPYWLPEQPGTPSLIENPPLYKNEETLATENHPNENDPRTTILLAEDNKDVALYIKALFPEDKYHILIARNGEKALSIANECIPDLIITDLIMPKKDGIELCREIKASQLLNHIPIIMLTAKSSITDQINGIKCGADAYICKPFNSEELQVRVEKLLEIRKLLKEKYLRIVFKGEKNSMSNDINSDFLQQVTNIIYRDMKNAEFSSKKLADEMAISISQLNKKLNALTGFPASTYILQVKLELAKKILSTYDRSIGEVAAECGIYDVNYFARVFKKHIGISPSKYQRLPR